MDSSDVAVLEEFGLLDTAVTVGVQGKDASWEGQISGDQGSNPDAGAAPNGTESRTGVKVISEGEVPEDEDYFRHLMETNTPPPGIGASNRDWLPPYSNGG